MNDWSPDRKRQYVLEQAIMHNIAHVRNVMQSLEWRLDGYDEDLFDRHPVDPELIFEEIEKAKVSILTQLEGLLKSVTLSYRDSVLEESNQS